MAWYWVALIVVSALAAGGFLVVLWFGALLLRAYKRGGL